MKISFNPSNSNKNILDLIKNNKDIIFDLKGHSIFARGVEFKGTDTNTWRDIKINNVSIGSHTLDLRNGSNTTLTNTNGVVTINSTWRPVVDNLTSDSTTSSLSAKQGKVLKALIDGKSNSDHNHDGRYLRLSGQDTMQGNLYLHSHGTSYIGKGLGNKSGADFTEANIVIRSWWGISFKSYDDIVRTYIDTRTGNIGTKGVLNAVGAVIQGRVYNGGDDEGIIINPASNGYAGLILGTHNGERSVFYLNKGNPFWRYNNGSTNLDIYHPKKSGTIALTSDIPDKNSWNYDDRYLRLTGGWMSGDINFGGDNKIYWGRNTDSASISFKNDGDGDANSYMSFVTSDNGIEYFRWSHSSGSTNTEWMALRSDGLRVRGTKVSLEGHSHNDLYYTKAESNAKYITDITTSVNKLTFTKNGSNIIRDITVNVVHSQGRLTNIPNKDATTKASPGLLIYDSYEQTIGTNSYSSVLSINTGGTIQIAGNWGDDNARNLYWRSQSGRNVADYPWKSWRTILDSENYSSTLDSRYYTESEVNSLLDAKLNRQNLSYGTWNPRGYHLAADYHYNGGDISISENNGKMYVSVDGCFWQNEGQYRVLDTSDIGDIKNWSDRTASAYWKAGWYKVASAQTATNIEAFLTLDVNAAKSNGHATLFIRKRADSKPYFICTYNNNLNLADFRLYYNGMSMVLYARVPNDWNGRVFRIISEGREGTYDHIWTLYSNMSSTDPNAISAEGGNPYINPTYSGRVDWSNSSDKANYANSAGSVAWNNVTGKPSAFNPAAHTHTVFKNNLMIKGTNGISDSASIHLGIGDSDTGFKWISDGVCQIYANNVAVGQWTSGGMNWFKNPTVNGNKVWNAGNDGSGSGLDADTLDGYHESSFLRYRGSYEDASVTKDGVGVYGWDHNNTGFHESYGDIINIQGHSTWRTRFDIGISGRIRIVHGINTTTATQVGYLAYLHDNVASATNAYHLRINSANTWSTWYWAGQSGQPSWLWGSNDGTNMYVWNPSNFNVNTAQYLRSLGNQNCQTGRTQAYGDVYTYNTHEDNTGSPTTYSSVIGFGRGIAGTVEIAGGWCNTHLYWRSLRDCCEDWFPWRTVLDSSNYTEFINNYYWANVKISTSSSTTTSPTVSNLTATSSIRLGNIHLEHTNEINSYGGLLINYRSSADVDLCQGGGNVCIGATLPTQKLDVRGNIITKGLGIQPYYLSKSVLPTIRLDDGYTYKCLEISATTEISCIIADRAIMSERGILIKFNKGYDGQIILLKDLESYGSGNGYFWVMPSGCKIIKADGSSTLISQNEISDIYDDGRSRFFVFSSVYSVWIEFLCSNTI